MSWESDENASFEADVETRETAKTNGEHASWVQYEKSFQSGFD